MYSSRYSREISMKLEFFSTDFRKILNIKFYENPPNRRLTDLTKLVVAFRHFANAPNK